MTGPLPDSDPLIAARQAYLEAAEAIMRAYQRRGQTPQARLTDLLQEALSAGRAASAAVRFSLIEQGDATRRETGQRRSLQQAPPL
ncbi:hypothetical protein AB0C02_13510 [Micromonospora sp. NPDC048999]|uniref:hypothetical protein n=1 Tax=Micromonospora sp. NPDC048999 TaxID=3155391 RepID=UPI0034010766